MIAVVISAGMTAVAGVFFAFYYNNLFPEQVFHISRSIELILAPIIGGIGTLFGPILGAFLLTGLSEARHRAAARARLRLPRRQAGVLRHLPADRGDRAARRHLAVAGAPARPGAAAMSAFFCHRRRVEALPRAASRSIACRCEVREGRDLRGDRPERRRQDHAVQHDRRRVRAGRGRDRVSGRAHRRTAPGRSLPPRHRAHLPDRAAVPGADASRTTSWSARCCARPIVARASEQRTR